MFTDQKFLLAVTTAAVLTTLTSSTNATFIDSNIQKRPNIIVIQPDDHLFLEEWNPPARFEQGETSSTSIFDESYISPVPNINRLRNNGLEMTNAYSASTMCGTSRYSTLTGRLPSRSAYGRENDQNGWTTFNGDNGQSSTVLREIVIPKTKLEDTRRVQDGNDCTANNLAAILKSNGYSTGVVGKWHLEDTTSERGALYNNYPRVQDKVRNCGFDFAEAIYRENMGSEYNVDGGYVTHNMEHLTSEAIRFIHESVANGEEETEEDKPFFLYFNPTVPHDSGDVTDALMNVDCKETVQGRLSEVPYIPYGMTADFDERDGCSEYRQSVLDRATASGISMNRDKLAGAVWVDDAIGSLVATLEAMEILDNTLILFQLDHGMDAKGSLFEGGSRIAQFIHYPDQIKVNQNQAWKFEGLVSTIDIAPTLMDLAGIPSEPSGANSVARYDMDGKSWFSDMLAANFDASIPQKQERQQKPFVNTNYFQDRCLFTEEGYDRAVRCGCYKYLYISNTNNGRSVSTAKQEGVSLDNDNFYNLCDEVTGDYLVSPDSSPELWPRYYNDRISDDIKTKLKSKISCLVKQTDPSNQFPDYETDCSLPLNGLQTFGPIIIDVVKNDSDSSLPEWSDTADSETQISPSSFSTFFKTMPKYALVLFILALIVVPLILFWICREVCETYRSKVAPIKEIGADPKKMDSLEQMHIEAEMLGMALANKGNHLVAVSTTVKKTRSEVAHSYSSSNPSMWHQLVDGIWPSWNVTTVSGTVVGTSSDSSVATDDVTAASSGGINASATFDSYQEDDVDIYIRRVISDWDASNNGDLDEKSRVEYEEV